MKFQTKTTRTVAFLTGQDSSVHQHFGLCHSVGKIQCCTNFYKTRMHSSRMRTARSLTVSHCIRKTEKTMHAPPNKTTHPPNKTMHAPPNKTMHTPPPNKTMHPPNKTTHAPPHKTTHAPPNKTMHAPRIKPCMPPPE